MNVTPDGPITASLWVIGEAPGRQEARTGIPFFGPTGKSVRGVFDRAGLTCYPAGRSKDVYFNNVIPYNPGTVHANQIDSLVGKHWSNLDAALKHGTPKVIIACGGVALRRLTGHTNISNWHGSVIPAGCLPATVQLAQTQYALGVPTSTLILPCLHPAGVMQTKLRAEWILVSAVLQRAAEYAKGKQYVPETVGENLGMTSIFYGSPGFHEALSVLERSGVVCIDTEFDRDTHVPFAVGFLGDASPMQVYWFKPEARMLDNFWGYVKDKQLVAQYHPAEIKSLLKVGCDLRNANWYDTLLAFSTLYPDFKVAIQHSTQFYCDNEMFWKDLATTDPKYLAKDVRNCYRVFLATRKELAENDMLGLFFDEVMPSMALMERMEEEGLEVDTEMQAILLEENKVASTKILARLLARVPASEHKVKRSTEDMKALMESHGSDCEPFCDLHPNYNGLRKKKFANNDDCICRIIYERISKLIPREYARPFQPSNPHDLRWLLYDHWKLPKQRPAKGSKSPSTGADAIRKLTMQIEMAYRDAKKKSKYYRADAEEIVAFMLDCKELQHLEKMRSTFLAPPVDDQHIAHPPHRLWGTGTGRLAGGFDESVSVDGATASHSFNPLNIPKETRKLFKADTVLLCG